MTLHQPITSPYSLAFEGLLPTVTPLAVYAAGRSCFDCIVRGHPTSLKALGVIFAILPMRENGWTADNTSARKIGIAPGGYIWRIRRKQSLRTADAQAQQQAVTPLFKASDSTLNRQPNGGR